MIELLNHAPQGPSTENGNVSIQYCVVFHGTHLRWLHINQMSLEDQHFPFHNPNQSYPMALTDAVVYWSEKSHSDISVLLRNCFEQVHFDSKKKS